jgi:hypothetical protein
MRPPNAPIEQVLTGTAPYSLLPHDAAVVIECLVHGRHPRRPTDDICPKDLSRIWSFLERCWSQDPRDRPTASEVRRRLEESK